MLVSSPLHRLPGGYYILHEGKRGSAYGYHLSFHGSLPLSDSPKLMKKVRVKVCGHGERTATKLMAHRKRSRNVATGGERAYI